MMEERDLLSKIAISKDGKELGKIARVIGKDSNFRIFKKDKIDIELTEHLTEKNFRISVLTCDIAQVDTQKVWLDITKEEFDKLVSSNKESTNNKSRNKNENEITQKSKILKKIVDPE